MEYNPNRKSEQKLKIAIGVLSVLVGILGFLYFRERQQNHKQTEISNGQAKELLQANIKLDSISSQLSSKIIEIKRLGGNVEELMRVKTQLEADKIAMNKMGGFSMKKYESKIKNYVALLSKKDQEIATLRRENGVLVAQNDSLNKQTQSLLEGISFAQKALSDSNGAFSMKAKDLADRNREAELRNRELSDKVIQAAAMRAENINIYAISSKGKEADGGSYKAKRVDKIRVSFHLQENDLTEKDQKIIYLRILEPSGSTVADMATGSGTFPYKAKETTYTAKQRIIFDNTNQLVEFVYSRGMPYKEGKHVIELYSEGYRIGEGIFEVK